MPSTPKVLIVGGGVAGLEAALALRDLTGDQTELELLTPRHNFLYRPLAVGEPYGTSHVASYDLNDLAARGGFNYRLAGVHAVNAARQTVSITDEDEIAYDYLVIAVGVKLLWSLPGATMFWGGGDEFDSELVVGKLGTEKLEHLVFTMPGERSWSLPLYELALLAEARLSEQGHRQPDTRLTIVTPEETPLRLFGQAVSQAVMSLLDERGIELVPQSHPVKFEQGMLQIAPGEPIEADAVICLPKMEGRHIANVPRDEHGFIPIDHSGQVLDLPHVYAAGDVTAFPVKQGGIASQQADVAAEAIAAEMGFIEDPKLFDPVLRGVLWTGLGKKYLYSRLRGGHGEQATLTDEPPWPEEGKIVSRYLSPFLANVVPT